MYSDLISRMWLFDLMLWFGRIVGAGLSWSLFTDVGERFRQPGCVLCMLMLVLVALDACILRIPDTAILASD